MLNVDPTGLINWETVGTGSIEIVAGMAGIIGGAYASSSVVGATIGIPTAIGGAGTFSHGVTQVIVGALDKNPTIPQGSWTSLTSLATGQSINTANRNDAVADTLLASAGLTNTLLHASSAGNIVKGALEYSASISAPLNSFNSSNRCSN